MSLPLHSCPGAREKEEGEERSTEEEQAAQGRSAALQADSLATEPQGKPKNTGVGSLSLLQWIFLTQESNQGRGLACLSPSIVALEPGRRRRERR